MTYRPILTALGLIAALVVTLALAGIEPFHGLKLLAEGAFGDKFGLARTLVRASPLLLCGLGMTLAWRAGMYNVGGEGQYVLGGVAGAAVAKGLAGLAPGVLNPLILLACALGGASLAWLAGWLEIRRGVQCVISTILLNFLMLQALAYLVRGPLQEAKRQLPLSDRLPNAVMFHRPDPQTDLHAGVVFGGLAVVAVWLFLDRSIQGYKVKVAGLNPKMARANRLGPESAKLLAMALSGGLCGLGAGIDYLGLTGQIGDGFSQNWGFLAIPVALLGALNPWGVLAASLYFGALMAGSEGLARFNTVGSTLVYVIQALAVLGVVWLSQVRRVARA